MPRGRFLSRVISLDEKVDALSDDTARLLFTWLIPHLDCEGRQYGDPITIKSIVFPRRNISPKRIEKYLVELEKTGLIVRYSVNGNTYLFSPQFEKHQTGLQKSKEAQSQIPPITPELLQSKSRVGHLQVKGKVKGKVKEETTKESVFKKELAKRFGIFWEAYPKKVSKGQAEKAFQHIHPSEGLMGIILAAISKQKKSDDWLKEGGKYIKNPSTWLNARCWEDEIRKGGGNGSAKQNLGKLPAHYAKPEEFYTD